MWPCPVPPSAACIDTVIAFSLPPLTDKDQEGKAWVQEMKHYRSVNAFDYLTHSPDRY